MPRIVITAELSPDPSAAVLLDEQVHCVHLSSGHAAEELVQRLAWAISDAEDAENHVREQRARPARRPSARRRGGRAVFRLPAT